MKRIAYISTLIIILCCGIAQADKPRVEKPVKSNPNKGTISKPFFTVTPSRASGVKQGGRKRDNNKNKKQPVEVYDKWSKLSYIEVDSIFLENIDENENVITDKDSPLYEDEMRYLRPTLQVTAHTDEPREINLYVKLFDPENNLEDNANSPEGYTYKVTKEINPNTKTIILNEWGDTTSIYPAGDYRLEVWSDMDNKLYSHTARIRVNDREWADFAYMSVREFHLDNVGYDNEILTDKFTPFKSEDMRFLHPVMYITPHTDDVREVTLYVKVIDPDGSVRTTGHSPEGFTFAEDTYVSPATTEIDFRGIGSGRQSNFPGGLYRVEVWSDKGKMLAAKNVNIEDCNQHWEPSEYFSINSMTVDNVDYENKIISNDHTLYAGEMRFLRPILDITPTSTMRQDTRLYVKIVKPDGNLDHGNISPYGYSYSFETTILPDTRSIELPGWGSNVNSVFKPGVYRIEIWSEDGKQLYSQSASIYDK